MGVSIPEGIFEKGILGENNSRFIPRPDREILIGRGIGRGILHRTYRTEHRIIHVGFREILYSKGARKVEELEMLHLHFTPH